MITNEQNERNNWTDVYVNKEELKTKLMQHLVSPLEMAATNAEGEAFAYEMDGIKIWVNEKISYDLVKMSSEKIKFIEILTQKLMESLGDITSEYAAFLNSPISEHKLSTRTFHCLKGNACEIMLDVAKLGRRGLSRIRGLGQKSTEEVRKVFIREGCIELFD